MPVDPPGTTSTRDEAEDVRVRPTVLVGLAVVATYAVLITVDDLLPGGGDGEITDPTLAFLRTHVLPLTIIAVLLVVFVRRAGWWAPVWHETPRQRVPRWWWAFPAVYLVVIAGNLSQVDWTQAPSYLVVVAAGTLLVGFTEELALRGILLTGARGSWSELPAFFLTCLVFGALHTLNLLHGAPLVPTLIQVAVTSFLGAVYYAIRRAAGGLWLAIALHFLADFALYAAGYSDSSNGNPPLWGAMALTLLGVLSIPLIVSVARQARQPR